MRARGSRFMIRAIAYTTMSVTPASTAPANSSTVKGVKPSVTMRGLRDSSGARGAQRGALAGNEAAGAAATPVPGAPVAVRGVTPTPQERGGRVAAVFSGKLRQRVEQRRHRVRAQRCRVRRVEPPFRRGPRPVRSHDERTPVQDVQG